MSVLTLVSVLLAAPVAALFAIYATEVLAGLRADPHDAPVGEAWPRTVVLIPAHDEAAGIGATLAALPIAGGHPIETLVVADNCSDDTAARARAAGARVIERHDPERRGKGYALAFGRDALAAAPPECVVVLDADCTIAEADLRLLAHASVASARPVQSCYLLRRRGDAPAVEQVSNFAFLVKNLVRQRGMMRVGGVAVLTGSGMAIPWAAFRDAPLANDDIVEDLALGIWLARNGWPPRFDARATTWSDPASGRDLLVQRSRWERGFVATARRRALPLVGAGLARGSLATLWLGLHLLVPPLALLFAVGGAALVVTALLGVIGAGWAGCVLLAGALALGAVATVLAWRSAGREAIAGRTLLRVPLYVAAKLPIYLRLGKTTGWVRTRRANEERH